MLMEINELYMMKLVCIFLYYYWLVIMSGVIIIDTMICILIIDTIIYISIDTLFVFLSSIDFLYSPFIFISISYQHIILYISLI